jgi:hypothetical protein
MLSADLLPYNYVTAEAFLDDRTFVTARRHLGQKDKEPLNAYAVFLKSVTWAASCAGTS